MLRLRLLTIAPWVSRTMTAAVRPLAGGQFRNSHSAQTKGDKELATFLAEEIVTETKSKKSNTLAKALDSFVISTNQAEIKFTKKINNEEIVVSLNVNHTVDAEPNEEQEGGNKSPEQSAEMRSKPNFDIDIKKGNQTLNFSCSFLQDDASEEGQEEYNDVFLIEEITLYEGEWKEENYCVAGDILDGYLYDLFMNMLEERGITSEFVEKLSDFSTEYEHDQYVGMLRKLQTFFHTN